MRITPENIQADELNHAIFVFGSNESGIHGAGAALFAKNELHAREGTGFGRTSPWSFAIPTKDWGIKTLPLSIIIFYVHRFIEYAIQYPEQTFYVTQIGCGLAGYTPEDIAPMFRDAMDLKNVYLPQSFLDVLNNK